MGRPEGRRENDHIAIGRTCERKQQNIGVFYFYDFVLSFCDGEREVRRILNIPFFFLFCSFATLSIGGDKTWI